MNEVIARREHVGKFVGWLGIGGNLLLTILKLAVGCVSNSMAIIADAFNNLTDCASSVATILGFSLSTKEKDSTHPYGHGRMEYICGLMIANFILFTAVSVGKNSLERLIFPEAIQISATVIVILLIGIVTKLAMAIIVKYLNKEISSATLKAVRNDNLSDALVTTVALLGVLCAPFTELPLDGLLGVLVSIAILWSGLVSFSENIVLLLGEGVTTETEKSIRQIVMRDQIFQKVESVALHDYGPQEKIAFIKVAFGESFSSLETEKSLKRVQQQLKDELHLDATLYWDMTAKI